MTWPFENDTSSIVKKLADRSMKADKRSKLRFHVFRCRQRHSTQPFQFSGGRFKKDDLALMPPQELFFIIRFTVSVIKRL